MPIHHHLAHLWPFRARPHGPVRLRVLRAAFRDRAGRIVVLLPGWTWHLTGPEGETLDSGWGPTWRGALALGAAARAVAVEYR